jgi:hypothetical protein
MLRAGSARGAGDELIALCGRLAGDLAREEHGGWAAAQFSRYRCAFAVPWDLFNNIAGFPTVLPIGGNAASGHAAMVVDPVSTSAVLPALAPVAKYLRKQGYRVHLAAFGGAALCWPAPAHELFDSVIPVPLSWADPAPVTVSCQAYLGTPLPRISNGDLATVVGTLAGFDLVITVENSVAHAAAGRLRDLQVETWALLGTGAANAAAAEIVNACAAFEYAYQRVLVLDAHTSSLCRALGLPAEKLWHWAGHGPPTRPRS